MVSITITGDEIEVTGTEEELTQIAKLHYIDEYEDKIKIKDPIPNNGRQIANAVFWNERRK